jgi:predicted dinucleotide-binding enzyme
MMPGAATEPPKGRDEAREECGRHLMTAVRKQARGSPVLLVCDTDSLGEQIQPRFPRAKVVKAINTMNAYLMVEPARLAGGDHTAFVSGNDAEAKAKVVELLRSFGWSEIIELGDISTARGTELYLPLWVRLYGGAIETPIFNLKVVR